MISLQEILLLHEKSIQDFGGSPGVRDYDLLESAAIRPFQSFEGVEFYSTVFEKTASLLESIIKNHPFIDGNKRTGLLAVFVLLYRNDLILDASQEDAYSFIIKVASSEITFEEITLWFQQNSKQIEQ